MGCVETLLEENYQTLVQEEAIQNGNGNGGIIEEEHNVLINEEGMNHNENEDDEIKSDLPLNSKVTIKKFMSFLENLLTS